MAVDQADVEITEPHDMVSSLELGDANDLIAQSFADEDQLAMPFDLAIAADPADLMISVVPGVFHPRRHGAWRGEGV
jgi:hypothetical protein